jgi:peptide deformylase
MAILKIAKLGHPVLQKKCAPLDDPTSTDTAKLAKNMKETLAVIGGMGLAAPQVHNPVRMVVFHLPTSRIAPGSPLEPWDYTTLCNPVLTPLTQEKIMNWEKCLSIPGLHGKVPRHTRIRVEYQDLAGESKVIETSHLLAYLLQHECDHLDGVVYPMRMTDMTYLAFNSDPGRLSREVAAGADIDPLFKQLGEAWPEKDNWL